MVLKKLLVMFLAICMVLPFAVACGGNGNGDGAPCTHDNEVICNKCGEIVLGDSYYTNMVKSSNAVIGKGKGVKVEATGSFSVQLGEEIASYSYEKVDGTYGTLKPTNAIGTLSATMTAGFKSDGKVYADGNMDLVVDMKDNGGTILVKNSLVVEKVKVENNVASFKMVIKELYPTLSTEEKLINEYEYTEEENVNIEESEEASQILGQIVPMVLDVYSDTILPYVNGIIDTNSKDINTTVATMLDGLCTVSKNGENNVFTMTKLGANLNQLPVLADTDISVVFDGIFGAGSYDNIPETVDKLLNTKIEDIISLLEEKGIKIDELVEVADEVCKQITGDETATLEALIGVDIVEFIDALDKTKTIKQILVSMAQIPEEQINQFLVELEEILNQYKDKSIYEIIALASDVEITQEQKDLIKNAVNKVANFVDEAFKVQLVADKNGNLVSFEYGLNLDMSTNASKELVDLVMSFVSPEDGETGAVVDVINSIKGNLTYKTSFITIA